jgi:hypothetical protein
MTVATDRALRVFISSTFRDMQAERDELVKRVFPELRKMCEERGVTWGEVDLRWGITDEQKAEGNVLPICLAEIRGCRPYFIGILGERHGWVPNEIPLALTDDEPWLEEDRGRSVTELEILHGVLNDPEMADHALFYFRIPAYVDTIPEAQRSDFLELPTAEEIELLGHDGAEARARERRERLRRLKQRIRDSGFPVREDYPDPVALGALVLADLTAIIDRVFPAGSEPDPLEREAAEHEAFARSRAAVYVGRPEYLDELSAHADADGPPLVAVGDSGSGKSALLANWGLQRHGLHRNELLVMHFVGAGAYSADWAAMLRRIIGELQRSLRIEDEIPAEPAALRTAFARWLHMAGEHRRVTLVVDGLDQLEDRDGAPDLVWLPDPIPPRVGVIVSTLPGRPLDELLRRGAATLRVEPLAAGERRALIADYLRQYGRALGDQHIDRIVGAPQSANPLYLRALLEELPA